MTKDSNASKQRSRVESFLIDHPELEPQIEGHGPVGWDELIGDALFEISKVAKATGVTIKIAQIKEKFGGLRLYADIDEASATHFDDVAEAPSENHFREGVLSGMRVRVQRIVDVAAERAAKVCVRCGQPATRNMGFYKFCSEHSSAYS